MFYYHVTKMENLDNIKQNGLILTDSKNGLLSFIKTLTLPISMPSIL